MTKSIFFLLTFVLTLNANNIIKPIPQKIDVNIQKATLGKKLFSDPQLSVDNTVSCENCHNLNYGGADANKFSFGVKGRVGSINSPTVFNSVFNIAQFWDGRAKDLKEQVKGPLSNHVEMASDPKKLIIKLSKDPQYTKEFKRIYKDGITLENVSDAIAEFEKTLITPNSKFDLYLRGDKDALSDEEKKGYKLFKNLGCISCHNGVNMGSNMFQKFGIFDKHTSTTPNLGRYNVTKNEDDKYYFKVPTLRNIEKTAPYFHDGSAKTLEEAVKTMGYYQLGQQLTQDEIKKLTLFLKTLNGELPKTVLMKD